MTTMNIVQAINLALKQEMQKDSRVVLLGEDIGKDGGVFRVTEGLYEKFPSRVIDTPLAEVAIVGTAIGMAVYGLRPVVELQFEGFMPPAFDQLISHAARIRTRSRGRFSVPLVVRFPYSGGIHAPEHHSESTEALLCHTPGLKVVVPSSPYDAKGLLISAIRDPDPVIFMEPKKIYRAIKEDVPEKEYTISLEKARVWKKGNDLTIFCWGAMRPLCEQAVQQTKVDAEIVDLRTLSPLDLRTILDSVKKTGRALIVHEAPKTCGLGAELAALLSDRDILYLEAPLVRVTGFDTIMPLYKLEDYYLPNVQRIVWGIKKVMSY